VNSPFSSNTLGELVLISAGVLLCTKYGFAAEPVGDAQMQARDLLAGTVAGQARSYGELESARRMILGRGAGETAAPDSERSASLNVL
jgi:hypothetical protein